MDVGQVQPLTPVVWKDEVGLLIGNQPHQLGKALRVKYLKRAEKKIFKRSENVAQCQSSTSSPNAPRKHCQPQAAQWALGHGAGWRGQPVTAVSAPSSSPACSPTPSCLCPTSWPSTTAGESSASPLWVWAYDVLPWALHSSLCSGFSPVSLQGPGDGCPLCRAPAAAPAATHTP